MIVGIDGRSLARGREPRGVAHYTASLAGALAGGFPADDWRLLVPGGEPGRPVPGTETIASRLPSRVAFGASALVGRPRLDRMLRGPDVVWAPAPAPLATSRDVPVVLTIHDLSFEERPGDYTPYERLWHRLGRLDSLARRAERVIAVSETTRRATLARWDLDPERVATVRSGVTRPAAPPDPEAARARLGLPKRYYLFVGALEPRKAPDLLARAFARARRGGLEADLVFAGSGRLARALEGPGVHLLGSRGRPDLEALYAGALALVLPSHAEGFGWPPLEAAACGTPSIVSDIPIFHETLGQGSDPSQKLCKQGSDPSREVCKRSEAAVFVAPGDEAALAGALSDLAGDPARRERLAAAAARAIEPLTWERAARETHACLAAAAAR
jgi:glycosyltransferase involved in cell wall biosynthesis